jgi:hypothetical protein
MSELQQLIEDFTGGDPIAGNAALHRLVDIGDEAEDELFAKPLPDSVDVPQIGRRFLRYVATREKTVAPRLIERIDNKAKDDHKAAFLMAGIVDHEHSRPVEERLRDFYRTCDRSRAEFLNDVEWLKSEARNLRHDSSSLMNLRPWFEAHGYALRRSSMLRDIVKLSHTAWKNYRFRH